VPTQASILSQAGAIAAHFSRRHATKESEKPAGNYREDVEGNNRDGLHLIAHRSIRVRLVA
jgi:hypothetical protein